MNKPIFYTGSDYEYTAIIDACRTHGIAPLRPMERVVLDFRSYPMSNVVYLVRHGEDSICGQIVLGDPLPLHKSAYGTNQLSDPV